MTFVIDSTGIIRDVDAQDEQSANLQEGDTFAASVEDAVARREAILSGNDGNNGNGGVGSSNNTFSGPDSDNSDQPTRTGQSSLGNIGRSVDITEEETDLNNQTADEAFRREQQNTRNILVADSDKKMSTDSTAAILKAYKDNSSRLTQSIA